MLYGDRRNRKGNRRYEMRFRTIATGFRMSCLNAYVMFFVTKKKNKCKQSKEKSALEPHSFPKTMVTWNVGMTHPGVSTKRLGVKGIEKWRRI